MSAKLEKTIIVEIYDDGTTRTYVKMPKNSVESDIKAVGNFPVIVKPSRSWDTVYIVQIPSKSNLMSEMRQREKTEVNVELLGRTFKGKLSNIGRITCLSKLYEFAREQGVTLGKEENLILSYKEDDNTIVIEFINKDKMV